MSASYPKWLYHSDGRAVIVQDESEAAELELDSGEWAETPAAFPADHASDDANDGTLSTVAQPPKGRRKQKAGR